MPPRRCIRVAGARTFRSNGRYRAKCNLTPQSWVPVVVSDAAQQHREVRTMRWGLVPSYAKAEDEFGPFGGGNRPSTFNARVETVGQSNMWRRLVEQRRCLVLFDGFYEWKSKDGKKTPMFIRHRPEIKETPIPGGCSEIEIEKALQEVELNAQAAMSEHATPATNHFGAGLEDGGMPLLLAGLYDAWSPPDGGDTLETVSILTMDPMGTPMESIHDRMPVFLSEETAPAWLTASAQPPFETFVPTVLKEARRVAKERLQIYEVSDLVGNIRNDTPECLAPRKEVAKRQFENGLGRFFAKKAKTEDTGASQVGTQDTDGASPPTQDGEVKLPISKP